MERVKAGVATTHRDQLPASSRYELLVKIASGGMATVYVGRLSAAQGFRRLVAIKRAHAHLLEDPATAKMLVAEARLAANIHHPNVVAVRDVEQLDGELLLVMDYVEGASLAMLQASETDEDAPLAPPLAVRILLDACAGLHAAHRLTDEDGKHLELVHRDVSPHNILVGIDGIARLADFGIAKVSQQGSASGTATGALKGKVAYMPPEYVEAGRFDVRSDVFALGVVAWEALTQRRLFKGANDIETLKLVHAAQVAPPSSIVRSIGAELDRVILKALDRVPDRRFASAEAFGEALEAAARARTSGGVASHAQVAEHLRGVVGGALEIRRELVRTRTPRDDTDPQSETAIRIAKSGDPRTVTVPAPPASLPADVAVAPKEPTLTTIGTSVSAPSPASAEPLGARPRSAIAIAILAFAGVTIVAGLGALGVHRTRVATETPNVPSATPASATASVPLATAEPAAVIELPTSELETPDASAGRPHRKPMPAARPASSDKAPPNPYASSAAPR